MWIQDITKALWILNGTSLKWSCCVDKIENGFIYMSDGQRFAISALVEQYDKEYPS